MRRLVVMGALFKNLLIIIYFFTSFALLPVHEGAVQVKCFNNTSVIIHTSDLQKDYTKMNRESVRRCLFTSEINEKTEDTTTCTTATKEAGSSTSKYQLSSEDEISEPYQADEQDFSDKEYIPDRNEDDVSDEHSSTDTDDNLPKRAKIRVPVVRIERLTPSKLIGLPIEDSLASGNVSENSSDPKVPSILFLLVLKKNQEDDNWPYEVHLIAKQTVHKNEYRGMLVGQSENYVAAITEIHPILAHECTYSLAHLSAIGACFWNTDFNKVTISTNCCLEPRTYVAKATYIETLEQYCAFLVDKSDQQMHPSTSKASPNISAMKLDVPHSAKSNLHFCIFCRSLKSTIARHLTTRHRNQTEIAKILPPTVDRIERRKVLEQLRKRGDEIYNKACVTQGLPHRIVRRRSKVSNPTEYLACPNCKVMYSRRNVSRHEMECTERKPTYKRVVKTIENKNAATIFAKPDKNIDRILIKLSHDDVGLECRKDETIMGLVKFCGTATVKETHGDHNIRQMARMLGNLLLKLKELFPNSIKSFKEVLHPQQYDNIIEAIYRVCGMDEVTYNFRTPKMAMKYRSIITKCIEYWERDCLKKNVSSTSEYMETLQNFKKLFHSQYNSDVNKRALRTALENKLRKRQQLPEPSDIFTYTNYLKHRCDELVTMLQNEGFHYGNWLELGEILLLQLQILNRRRIGETIRIPLEAFKNREGVSEEQKSGLTRLDRILANNLELMQSIGKRGRVLNFLVKKTTADHIELYIQLREKLKLEYKNDYLFTSGNGELLNGYSAIVKHSTKSGVQNPSQLRGTALRKQVATVAQMFSLNENDIQQIADFMGHDIEVHKKVYRTPERTLLITKMAKYFMAVGDIDITKYRGKTLEEIGDIAEKEFEDETHLLPENLVELQEDLTDEIEMENAEIQASQNDLDEDFVPSVNLLEYQNPIEVFSNDLSQPRPSTSSHVNEVSDAVGEMESHNLSSPQKPRKKIPKRLTNTPKKQNTTRRIKTMWSPREKNFVRERFAKQLQAGVLPKFQEIKEFIKQAGSKLKPSRTVPKIYAWIQAERERQRTEKFQ